MRKYAGPIGMFCLFEAIAVPLWLAHILGELDVFPTGFSKYGVCYRDNILEKYINGVITCV